MRGSGQMGWLMFVQLSQGGERDLTGLGAVSVNRHGGQERLFLKVTAKLMMMVVMVIKMTMIWLVVGNVFPLEAGR